MGEELEEKQQAQEAEKIESEMRAKEEEEAAIKELRKNLYVKANPVPSFYKEGPPPKFVPKKIPLTRAKSPKLTRGRSCDSAHGSPAEDKCSPSRRARRNITPNSDTTQRNQPRGLEMIAHPPSHTQEAASQGLEGQSIPGIEEDPISISNPKTVNSSSTRTKKGDGSKTVSIAKNHKFPLWEIFGTENMDEINQGTERTLDHKQVRENLKDWTIEKKRHIKTGRVDTTYRHPKSKTQLKSMEQVKKFIKENSYQGRASDNGEGISQDPNVNLPSSSGELIQHPNVNISLAGEVFQGPILNPSSSDGELFNHPIDNISSSVGEDFDDLNVIMDLLGDPIPIMYSLDGEFSQHPNISSLGGGTFPDHNENFTSSSGVVLQDPLPCMNPNLHGYASMTEGYRQEQQMESWRSTQASSSNPMIGAQTVEQNLGSSLGYIHGMDRRLAGIASSPSAHLFLQSQETSYTQRQADHMLEIQNRALAEKVRALEEQNRATQAQVDYIQTLFRSAGITIPPTLGSGNANEDRRL